MTLGEYLQDHWLPNVSGSVRETTLVAYRGHVERYIVPALGDVRLRKLTTTAVNKFYRDLKDAPRRKNGSPRSTRGGHVHVTLRTALNAAVREGLLMSNPASRATAPKRRSGVELHTWSGPQVRTFLDSTIDDREHALSCVRLPAHQRRFPPPRRSSR